MCVAAAVTCAATFFYSGGSTPASMFGFGGESKGDDAASSRHLLSAGGSCDPTKSWEKVGGLIAYFVGVFFMFLGIAIVCDDFFVASLVGGGHLFTPIPGPATAHTRLYETAYLFFFFAFLRFCVFVH